MVGKTVIINDPASFYNGRHAYVKNEDKFGDILILWCVVLSATGNGTVEFAMNADKVL